MTGPETATAPEPSSRGSPKRPPQRRRWSLSLPVVPAVVLTLSVAAGGEYADPDSRATLVLDTALWTGLIAVAYSTIRLWRDRH